MGVITYLLRFGYVDAAKCAARKDEILRDHSGWFEYADFFRDINNRGLERCSGLDVFWEAKFAYEIAAPLDPGRAYYWIGDMIERKGYPDEAMAYYHMVTKYADMKSQYWRKSMDKFL